MSLKIKAFFIQQMKFLRIQIEKNIEFKKMWIATLSTSPLMWAYAVIAERTIQNPIPGNIGYLASTIHLISPFSYFAFRNKYLMCSLMLLCGIIHQTSFAYFTGGFLSNIPIWYGMLPFIAGFVIGVTAAYIWAAISLVTVSTFLILTLQGYQFPNEISSNGALLSQSLITIGWIFVGTLLIRTFISTYEKQQKNLEEQVTSTQNLLRVLVHDISNPLSVIMMRIKFLLPATENKKDLQQILKQSNNIQHIITNIRDLHSAESGKRQISLQKHFIKTSVDQALEDLHQKIQDKNILVELNIDPQLKILVHEDTFRFQVLGNLISNSIKFSEPGSKIKIYTQVSEENCTLFIQDEGIGIPKELLTQLFNFKSNTTRAGTLGEKGTGFGMPIVKRYLELMDAGIQVVSSTEETMGSKGTTFTLNFKNPKS